MINRIDDPRMEYVIQRDIDTHQYRYVGTNEPTGEIIPSWKIQNMIADAYGWHGEPRTIPARTGRSLCAIHLQPARSCWCRNRR